MDLRHARYFVAVAEERSFTRAARRVGIGQPPLSMQIKDLEEEIGGPLFHRRPQGVSLTAAGSAFLPEARALLAQADRALESATRGARGETGRLRIGFAGSAAFDPIVPRAVKRYRTRYPAVEVSLEESPTASLLEGLAAHRLDAVFVRPGPTLLDGVRALRLSDEPMVVALPSTHARAKARSVALAELAGERFVSFPRAAGPHLFDGIVEACTMAGFTPEIAQEVTQLTSIATFVAAGLGVAIVPAALAQVKVRGVAYVAIRGKAPVAGLAIATRLGEDTVVVERFLEITRTERKAP